MNAKVIWIGVLLLGPAVATAADDALDRARGCAAEPDSLQRLTCYDRVFRNGGQVPSATVTAPAPVAPTTPPATLPAPVAAAPAAAEPASAGESFGSDQLRRPPSGSAKQNTPRTLTAAVTELRETRPGVLRITLDNGQVWQQMDMDSLFHLQAGDTIEITRGKLGGYRMARQSRGGSGWVRVNRIK